MTGTYEVEITLDGESMDGSEISEVTLEHIAKQIVDGCYQGEVCEYNSNYDENDPDSEEELYGSWCLGLDMEDGKGAPVQMSDEAREEIADQIKDGNLSDDFELFMPFKGCIVVERTGRDYDCIATVKNNTGEDVVLSIRCDGCGGILHGDKSGGPVYFRSE